MEIYLNQIGSYLVNVFLASLNQLFILFGPFLVLAILLNVSATFSARLSVRFLGRNLFLYGFGWFGCSVHELSHAFFALLFGHRITEITLFEPNKDGESLGHVSHSYNKKSVYQKIGNFFIGIGPLLAGGIMLYLITLILFHIAITDVFGFRISYRIFSNILLLKQLGAAVWGSFETCKNLVLTGQGVVWWKSALWFYVLYSTGSSMTLSKSDLKGASSGLIWVIIFIFLFNLVTLWYGDFGTRSLEYIAKYISGFYFLLLLSFTANLVFILFFFVLNLLKNLFYRH